MTKEIHPFNKNVIFKNEETLIIGTFPAIKKLWQFPFFYSSSMNKLWHILQIIYKKNFKFDTGTETVEERINFLKSKKIAMIDIVEECERLEQKSNDNNLKIIALRDIYSILKTNKKIKRIIITSRAGKNSVLSLLKKELDEKYLKVNKINLKFKNFDRTNFEFKTLKSTNKSKILKAEIYIKDDNRKIDVFIPYSPSLRCFNKHKDIIFDMYKNSCFG